MDATREEWRPVVGYEGSHEVSNLGRVRSVDRLIETSAGPRRYRGQLLAPHSDRMGYMHVRLSSVGAKSQTFRVHLLVMAAFVGPLPEGMHTRHLNGSPGDNRLANLAYGTASENQLDRVRHGRHFNSLKTHCPQGHPYDAENTHMRPCGGRACRKCQKAANDAHYRRRKACG